MFMVRHRPANFDAYWARTTAALDAAAPDSALTPSDAIHPISDQTL
jgi:cephalosporin-C deacetylase-like acetyl esterase